MDWQNFEWGVLGRLLAATAVGAAIGLNRDVVGKPMGTRTLALVALGAAIVALVAVGDQIIAPHPDARSRVIQGVFQGVLTGIGFIGAGVIIYQKAEVKGLTTAATVWVTAALGIACGLGEWSLVISAVVLTLVVLMLKPLEDWVVRRYVNKKGQIAGNATQTELRAVSQRL